MHTHTRPDQRYPLTWPEGWPKTPPYRRVNSQFKVSPGVAMEELMDELRRLGARDIIISSNLMLRNDGLPYARQPKADDEAIAVYFIRRGKDMVLACDKYRRREENMRAISKTIEALRGIERWGSSDMMERAFTGFAALPPPTGGWRLVLDPSDPEGSYRRLRSQHHPDRIGGDSDAFKRVQSAWEDYQKEAGHG